MADLIRALLERPLDARVARAVVTLASAASVGFGVVIVLGVSSQRDVAVDAVTRSQPEDRRALLPAVDRKEPVAKAPLSSHPPEQDPQDRSGSAARERARQELANHRALQHVPFHDGQLRIDLVGARGARAVLAVSAPTRRQARRGYRDFLRRFSDDGRAYRFRYLARGARRG